MSTSDSEPQLAELELARPLQADICRSPGVYSWWLDTTRSPTPEAAGLTLPHGVHRLPHGSEDAELLYVGRTRRNLRQRTTGQHLRRTRSSALRRTLLLISESCWRIGAALDGRGRVVLDSDAEDRLTTWMHERLLLGWVPCGNKDKIDELEKRWIRQHQPVLNTDGAVHGPELTELKKTFGQGLLSGS